MLVCDITRQPDPIVGTAMIELRHDGAEEPLVLRLDLSGPAFDAFASGDWKALGRLALRSAKAGPAVSVKAKPKQASATRAKAKPRSAKAANPQPFLPVPEEEVPVLGEAPEEIDDIVVASLQADDNGSFEDDDIDSEFPA